MIYRSIIKDGDRSGLLLFLVPVTSALLTIFINQLGGLFFPSIFIRGILLCLGILLMNISAKIYTSKLHQKKYLEKFVSYNQTAYSALLKECQKHFKLFSKIYSTLVFLAILVSAFYLFFADFRLLIASIGIIFTVFMAGNESTPRKRKKILEELEKKTNSC
ncbi:hypothetical protein [Streptococcus oricebi]|uniref:Uncharacterized protein n=1 Tax=Streptococcus oricebi TaxID=1547447 RepID=A0ABS5B1A7_9STRE|nr:hypothetical protein [Streptococcus oricebi]MBP2622603.1 hypothetical protein [Streptococcus oricebi]